MESKYKLELVGITFNQIESGVYALILQQEGTSRRIPIIIGYPEAQAIQCKLQEIQTPRPLTHDTMVSTLQQFGIRLQEVFIKRLPHGVFTADMYFTDGKDTKVVDGRSSDAIALAIRTGAPIYTSEEVLKEAGFEAGKKFNVRGNPSGGQKERTPAGGSGNDYASLSTEQLFQAMTEASTKEDYEEAARIKAEIDKRNNQEKDHEK